MKKINILFLVLLGVIGFSSCEDSKDTININPKALDGTLSFQLNQPSLSNWVYVLEEANQNETMETLTCNQPDYGFTAAVTYTVQVSLDGTFADSTKFVDLGTTTNGERVAVVTKEINRAILTILNSNEGIPDPLETTETHIRLKAVISTVVSSPFETEPTVQPLYSNVIKLNIKPYFMELTTALPTPYFIIGLANGTWNNGFSDVGSSLIPLSLVADFPYDTKTGAGEFIYTGYFETSRGFKLMRDFGSWDEQWGSSTGTITGLVHNDGGAQNITVPTNGYYTIKLNSITNVLTIEAATGPGEPFSKIGLIGDFNGWAADVNMTPSETNGHNHIWYTTHTFAKDSDPADNNSGTKFRANAAWDTSWGGNSFPFALTGTSSSNIKYKAGTYTVVFNDVDGNYYFFKHE